MAGQITFTDNFEEFFDALKTAKAQALLEIGLDIQRDAALNSPVRTGNLRKSWTVQIDEDDSSVTIGVPEGALERDYAKYVEEGTSRQRAQHMLRDAVNANIGKFPEIIEINMQIGNP